VSSMPQQHHLPRGQRRGARLHMHARFLRSRRRNVHGVPRGHLQKRDGPGRVRRVPRVRVFRDRIQDADQLHVRIRLQGPAGRRVRQDLPARRGARATEPDVLCVRHEHVQAARGGPRVHAVPRVLAPRADEPDSDRGVRVPDRVPVERDGAGVQRVRGRDFQ